MALEASSWGGGALGPGWRGISPPLWGEISAIAQARLSVAFSVSRLNCPLGPTSRGLDIAIPFTGTDV